MYLAPKKWLGGESTGILETVFFFFARPESYKVTMNGEYWYKGSKEDIKSRKIVTNHDNFSAP
jgi:hypothetical protein